MMIILTVIIAIDIYCLRIWKIFMSEEVMLLLQLQYNHTASAAITHTIIA